MNEPTALNVKNLRKRFASDILKAPKDVLKGVSFEVGTGEIFGFLGPNGAGKTTTIKSITGLIHPDSGEISIAGQRHDTTAAKSKIGFMPERPGFYNHLTGRELLLFYASFFGISRSDAEKRADKLLKEVGMAGRADGTIRTYSKGMVQRLALAQALINEPELVILDEPMSGLDPIGRRDFRDILIGLKQRGVTVFFSSHIIPDVESLCDRVAVLIDGVVRAEGEIDEIVSLDVEQVEIVFTGIDLNAISLNAETKHQSADSALIRVTADQKDIALRAITDAGGNILRLNPVRASLEEILIERFQEVQS